MTDDGCRARLGDMSVIVAEIGSVFADVLEHGFQILCIDQQQIVVIRDFKGDVEHIGLRRGEVHQSAEEQRSHFGDGCAQRDSHSAVDIPEDAGVGLVGKTALGETE